MWKLISPPWLRKELFRLKMVYYIYKMHFREQFMESLTTADIDQLSTNTGALSVFTNEKGGILDDLILSKTDDDSIYVVTNAGCIDKDLPYLQVHTL